ncbi:hypothetical protein JCM10908_006284 [Rhodotorula pacifica]|uniref:uncharacterized protein n=1 Tax=Rhodotorula pacifica TaxID=1495444 RepID=UPI00316E38A8
MAAPADVGFLRSTAQRAGSFVLAGPRYALERVAVPQAVQRRVGQWTGLNLGSAGSEAVDAAATVSGITTRRTATGAAAGATTTTPLTLPSPITYLTSSYLFTSLSLAFLLHRIHHLVPPRQSYTTATAHGQNRHGMQRVMRPLVQVGVRLPGIVALMRVVVLLAVAVGMAKGYEFEWLRSSGGVAEVGWVMGTMQAMTRVLVRLLAWITTGWITSFLRSTSSSSPGLIDSLLGPVSSQGMAIDHPSLLWQAYLAICTTVTCETFVRALSDDLPHAHHQFNLLSFSFLLHVHSAPSSGAGKGGGGNTELYTYLLVTMLEILALQISYIAPHLPLLSTLDAAYRARVTSGGNVNNMRGVQALRAYRLPITMAFSLVAQGFAIRSWSRLYFFAASTTTSSAASADGVREAEEFGTVWLNKVPEVVLEVIVGSSVLLKGLAAVIRGEELSMENLVGPSSLTPQPEEDYAVALIKYATHLLSTTRLSGLAHELSPLEVLPGTLSTSLETLGFLEPPPCESEDCPVHGAENRTAAREAREIARNGGGQEVVLQRNGEVVFWDLVALDGHGNDLPGQGQGLRNRRGGGGAGGVYSPTPGYTNEIRRVSVESPYGAEVDSDGYAADGSWTGTATAVSSFHPSSSSSSPFSRRMAHIEGERKSALWRLIGVCARIALYLVWKAARTVRRSSRWVLASTIGWKRDEWEMEQRWVAEAVRERAVRDGEDQGGTSRAGSEEPAEGYAVGSRSRASGRRSRSRSPNVAAWSVGGGGFGDDGADDEDDDDEWLPDSQAQQLDSEAEEGDDHGWVSEAEVSAQEEGDEELVNNNPLVLYSDLSHPQQRNDDTLSPEELAPYLLAHHLSSSSQSGPLTRRRYRALLPGGVGVQQRNGDDHNDDGGIAALSSAIEHRRAEVVRTARARTAGGGDSDVARWMEEEREKWREGKSRFCVVCTVEERTVVLWPCRCLCLCESCRAALAERTTSAVFDDGAGGGAGAGGGGGGQLCPTCRTPVQGFSRIFTP